MSLIIHGLNSGAPGVMSLLLELIDRTGLILGLHPANERRRYKVTLSLIGWAQT